MVVGGVACSGRAGLGVGVAVGAEDERVVVLVVQTVLGALACEKQGEINVKTH